MPPALSPPPAVAVVTCAVLELEVEHYAQAAPNLVGIVRVEQGLHNEPDKLRARLQEIVSHTEDTTPADVIVLGYGLCSRGVEGVVTRRCQLVIPRAHDCITLLLGSKERYAQYVAAHPGTYWYSPGWNKHHIPPGPERHRRLRTKYVQQYGEDNADFLMESEQHWFQTYQRATYVHLTVGATAQDKQYTRDCAHWLKWNYDEQQGDPRLLVTLARGPWPGEDFLTLRPGQTIRMTADERVIEAVDAG